MNYRCGGKPLEIEHIETLLVRVGAVRVGAYAIRRRGIPHASERHVREGVFPVLRFRRGIPDACERYDRKLLIRLFLAFSAVSLALILGSVFLYFRTRDVSNSSSGDTGFSNMVMEDIADGEANGSLSAENAVEVVRSALENRNPARVEAFFILGASASTPQEAIELLVRIQKEDGIPQGYEPLGVKVTLAGKAEEVMVTSNRDGQVFNRLAQLVPGKGGWRIDLDSYARHASPGWNDILGDKCETGVVRIFVTPDNYYNGEKYNEDLWKCYALISPDVDDMLFGYASRGSAQEEAMDRIVAKQEDVHRAIIELVITQGQGRKQFEISRVLADDWLMGGNPSDTTF